MSILEKLSSAPMYLICGSIIGFVALLCVVFMVRAYRAGKAIGMDTAKMKRVIVSSATFSVLPSVGILLGVIALSGSLGIPWPWLRLSVIGALHYETQVAQGAAEQVGMEKLSGEYMTASGFATIALLMSVCIMWGMILSVLFNRKYTSKLSGRAGSGKAAGAGFGDERYVYRSCQRVYRQLYRLVRFVKGTVYFRRRLDASRRGGCIRRCYGTVHMACKKAEIRIC